MALPTSPLVNVSAETESTRAPLAMVTDRVDRDHIAVAGGAAVSDDVVENLRGRSWHAVLERTARSERRELRLLYPSLSAGLWSDRRSHPLTPQPYRLPDRQPQRRQEGPLQIST